VPHAGGVFFFAEPVISKVATLSTNPTMSDPFKTRTLKRKNVKGLALSAPSAKSSNPSEGDSQIPGAIGNPDSNRTDTLEIGLEFKLDLRSEDLIVLKELGAGNGGTVSKVMHAGTNVVMARKVCSLACL
jgi:mitogen-activated protein kinase kinase